MIRYKQPKVGIDTGAGRVKYVKGNYIVTQGSGFLTGTVYQIYERMPIVRAEQTYQRWPLNELVLFKTLKAAKAKVQELVS